MAKHTPGPWKLFNKNGIISIYKDNKEVIKWTGFDSSDYPKDTLANARLIAAAPDLLATCEALIIEQKFFAEKSHNEDRMPGNDFYSDKFMAVVEMAKAAIAKAKRARGSIPGQGQK